MGKGFRVTVEDLDRGESQSKVVGAGDYMLIPFDPCYLASAQKHANGTVQLTIKGHAPQLVDPAAEGGVVMMADLQLESRVQLNETAHIGPIMLTPPVDEDYWSFRVKLTEHQAIVGFPKFVTVGIGFAQEEDWNTNLPYTCGAEEILDHIWHNAGDESITREAALEAIRMVQAAAAEALRGAAAEGRGPR
jgi:hypothetical protein